MIVDIYTHIMPPEFLKSMEGLGASSGLVKRMSAIRELHDLDARFRAMDQFGDYRQIFSIPNPPLETVTTPAQGRDLARIANDAMADTVRRHPSRFPTFIAALPLHGPSYRFPASGETAPLAELVVASALNPSAPKTRAEPASHGFGITKASPTCRA